MLSGFTAVAMGCRDVDHVFFCCKCLTFLLVFPFLPTITDDTVYQAELSSWSLVIYGTSVHPYKPDPVTPLPTPPDSINPLASNDPGSAPLNNGIQSQNFHRPRFLPSDSPAVYVGPCKPPDFVSSSKTATSYDHIPRPTDGKNGNTMWGGRDKEGRIVGVVPSHLFLFRFCRSTKQ